MVEGIDNPIAEDPDFEEFVLLANRVELWIPVEEAGGYKLIQDTDNERREHGEKHIVEG